MPNSKIAIEQMIALAVNLQRAGKLAEAEGIYRKVIENKPDHAGALHLLGLCRYQLGDAQQAAAIIAESIRVHPNNDVVNNNFGAVLLALDDVSGALAAFDHAIALNPGYAEAFNNRGNALIAASRHAEALESFEKALSLGAASAQIHYNRGNALCGLVRHEEAITAYAQAIALRPTFGEAYHNRGECLIKLKRFQEALVSCDKAIVHQPQLAEAWVNRAAVLRALARSEEALHCCARAISINAKLVEAHVIRGNLLSDLTRFDQALLSFEVAMGITPAFPFLFSSWLWAKMQGCIWHDIEAAWEEAARRINLDQSSIHPFTMISIPSTPAQQQTCARMCVDSLYPASQTPLARSDDYGHERVRIGYFSADFHGHATAHLMAALLEKHDRSKFEIFGFSFGPATADAWRQRLTKAFDTFVDVSHLSDLEIATMARNLEIDIAIDLKGYTRDERLGIFALRPAPIQVTYLGYPGTTGADYMDYLIADAVIIPPAHRDSYAEKIVYLPHSYQANDSSKVISPRKFSREELGLPAHAFVFCCFNNSFKITPDVFDVWMRLLRTVKGSVLWLLVGCEVAHNNLCLEAERRGVSASRLVFASRMDLASHLARLEAADLFIDTFICGAHTTASDALWAGLPVITTGGAAFAGRVAASLLTAIGLPELITRSRSEYELLALDLANNPERLQAIRGKLATNRMTTPLFDTELFARHIEDAYLAMIARRRMGLAPDHIEIAAQRSVEPSRRPGM
jgi:predicted O-linked N-acetylglucosamine transferase (SPINDLY family)